jgi:hypothetical protein
MFWENFILSALLGVLSALKRSPQDVPKFKSILVHVLDDVCFLLGVTPPQVP